MPTAPLPAAPVRRWSDMLVVLVMALVGIGGLLYSKIFYWISDPGSHPRQLAEGFIAATAIGLALACYSWRRWTDLRLELARRAQLEAAIRSSAEHYRELFSAHPHPMWVFDLETLRFLAVNDTACEQYGYSREEFLNMTVLELRPPEDWEAARQHIARQGPMYRSHWRHRKKDGGEIEIEMSTHDLVWAGRRGRMTLARDVTDQRRAEAKLQESEAQFRLLLESTGEGIFSLDTEGVCIWCNPAAAHLLGYADAVELTGRPLQTLIRRIRPLSERTVRVKRRFEDHSAEANDDFFHRADGSRFPVEWRSYPMEREGRIAGSVVTFVDVEPRKRTERALRASEFRFQSLADSGIACLAIGKNDGRTVDANDAFLQLLGHTREELEAGEIRWDKYSPPDAVVMNERARQMINSGKPVTPWETEFRRRDGTGRRVLVGLAPLEDGSGAITIALDITELRHAQRTLKFTEKRYGQLFENNLAGVFSISPAGEVLEANPAFARLAGYANKEELLASGNRNLFPALAELLDRLRKDGSLTNSDQELRRSDGQAVPVLANLNLLAGAGSLPERVDGTVIDMTEQKKLEMQFRQAQKMEGIGRLAGGIAHDFNNLLTVINGYGELLLADADLEGENRARLEEMNRAGARAAALTRQLLAFSRRQVFQLKVVDLNTLVAEAEKMLRRLVGEDLEFSLSLAPNLSAVKADPGQIEQVLMNLVVNARDAMPDGGKLIIETQNVFLDEVFSRAHPGFPAGRYAMIAVTDNGIGMDETTRNRVFEPFFTTKPMGSNTGLGLATVFGIVKQSGGSIAVHSDPGMGTSMKVYLPAVEIVVEAEEPVAAPAIADVGAETILLVEDEEHVRQFARDVLEDRGYHVLAAEAPDVALEICKNADQEIHLLLTDVIMPKMNGPTLADLVTKQRPATKVLLVSGYPSDAVTQGGALVPHLAFLDKPFTPAALAAKVRKVLDGVAA